MILTSDQVARRFDRARNDAIWRWIFTDYRTVLLTANAVDLFDQSESIYLSR